MAQQVYQLIEAYAKNVCDTDHFTGELAALCCRGPGLAGLSEDEAVLLEELCAGAQRFSGGEEPFPGRDMLDETQFRAFFDRLYPELKCRMPYAVWQDVSNRDDDFQEG